MKRLTTLLFWLIALLASANDGVYYVNGNQIVPLKETDIAVTKEVLTITMGNDKFARVDVQYEFTNRGKAKTIDVGFEAQGPYDPGDDSGINKAGKHPEAGLTPACRCKFNTACCFFMASSSLGYFALMASISGFKTRVMAEDL